MSGQVIEIEANSLEEARERIKSQIPEGLTLLSEKIISDGKPKTIRTVADTTEAAFANAQNEIPTGASIFNKKVIAAPEKKVIMVEAFDEQNAKARLTSQIGDTARIETFKLKASGKQGFLGLGKKPNQYEAEVFQHAVVEIIYKMKVRISAEIGIEKKTPVTVIRDTFLKAGSDDQLTGTQKLQLLDFLRSIYNTNFSAESVRVALQCPNIRMRKYIEDFLREVADLK